MRTKKWKMMAATWLLLTPAVSFGMTTNVWDGGGANALASNPLNWVGDVAPIAGDVIILDTTTNKNMTWDLNISLGSWSQVGYTGTVTVATVYGTTGFTNLNITGDCTISNGVWTHSANSGGETNRLRATIGGNLVIGTGAVIDVMGKGYAAGKGPGVGTGGSYGGLGYQSVTCYGSIVAPTNLGSGGQLGSGGGAILLTVGGMIRNDGLICADGGATGGDRVGSGGSIWLTSGTLVGGGIIRANGGVSSFQAGGGGRVALVVTSGGATFAAFSGLISAYGGFGTGTYGSYGGAGTVYLRVAGQGPDEGTLIVDNQNQASAHHTDINMNVTGTAVGDVLIRNKGYLILFTNQVLTVGGIWSNGASFASQVGSQVIFAGGASSTSTIYGSNTFMGFICTNGVGKTLMFQFGKTNTIPAQGRLTLKGSAAATNLILRSTSDGMPWNLNVNTLADQFVMYVDVKDSDALAGVGAEVVAMNSQGRSGNFNWRFITVGIGETNTWTGNGSTVWSFSNNWSLARSPIEDDFIRVPARSPRYPMLDNHRVVNGIEIQSAASLSLAGYDLTVRKNATVAGAITASATEIITFQTNADFTGGAFTAARSTIMLTGGGDQSVNLADLIFYRINVLNSVGTVAFGGGFTATELRCEAPGGMRNMQFQQGATVKVRDLMLLGSTASTNIMLRSSSPGQHWNLAVTGYRWSVQGVNVRDSDASYGLPVPAAFSKDSGNNLNWLFNSSRSVWLGTSGVHFHTPANWFPAVVPGASDRVLVDAANPMTITGAVTLLDFTVGGGTGAASVTAYAPLTLIEDITVLSNGTLSLNRPSVVSNGLYVLAGGLLTHSGPQITESNKLNVTVFGNVGVDEGGVVNVTDKGYAAGRGPGFGTSCGSYGGAVGGGGPCYGSVVAPSNCGSGGQNSPGGGAIQLTASGEIRNDGLICTDGGSIDRAGSGGSIWLTSGTMNGIGGIRANAVLIMTFNPGAGGRISLVVTNEGAGFSGFTGPISAYGGNAAGSANYGSGAGTVYKQRASDLPCRGTVLVDNNNVSVVRYTEMPPSVNYVTGEVDRATFYIDHAATLRLVNNFTLGDIFLLSPNTVLDLGSYTLTIRSRPHALGSGVVTNYGAIVWWPDIPKGVIISTW